MLTVQRPTESTILYTVSTRSATRPLTARLTRPLLQLWRLLTALTVLQILLKTYRDFDPAFSPPFILKALFFPSIADLLTPALPPRFRLPVCALVLYFTSRRFYTTESLLVIRGLGLQMTTSSPSYLWTSSTVFIPTTSVRDVFVHEAFKGFEVRYFLCVVVDGEEGEGGGNGGAGKGEGRGIGGEKGLRVVFPTLLPRREILEQVWRGARACLHEPMV